MWSLSLYLCIVIAHHQNSRPLPYSMNHNLLARPAPNSYTFLCYLNPYIHNSYIHIPLINWIITTRYFRDIAYARVLSETIFQWYYRAFRINFLSRTFVSRDVRAPLLYWFLNPSWTRIQLYLCVCCNWWYQHI